MLANRRKIFVEFGDCDPSGIVFNPHYLRWFDASVHALLYCAALTLEGLIAKYGINGIPLVQNQCRFLAPCCHQDELIIETIVTNLGRSSFKLTHRVWKGDKLAVEGIETRVWTMRDSSTGKIRAEPLPTDVLQALSGGP